MAPGAHGEPYLDDELDQWPAATFEALEDRASRRADSRTLLGPQEVDTAAKQSVGASSAYGDAGGPIASGRPDRGSVINHKESSDYGSDDDDIINLDTQSMLIDRPLKETQGHMNRNGRPSGAGEFAQHRGWTSTPWNSRSNTSIQQRGMFTDQFIHPTSKLDAVNDDVRLSAALPTSGEKSNVDELLAQIRQLERERDGLHDAMKSATSNVQAKAGEILIVRSNYDKATKEYERRLADMQKQHTQELAKERAGLEAARRDQERVETNNRFLEHDLAQEAEKSRNLKKILKDSADNGSESPVRKALSTPRKTKLPPFRDGFEDNEVGFVSPLRGGDRSKSSTPISGAKRKRQSYDRSPVQPLILSQNDGPSPRDTQNPTMIQEVVVIEKMDPRFAVAQSILNHKAQTRDRRTIEVFGDYQLPSKPGTALAGSLYEVLTQYSTDVDQSHFVIKFCHSLCIMWTSCLKEKYRKYDPLHDLIDWLHFSILSAPLDVSAQMFQDIIPLCLATTDMISLPVAKAFKHPTNSFQPCNGLSQLINPMKCLELLLLICERCSTNPEALARFWAAMEFDFVLLILHRAQPLPQIKAMLRLLYHSILPTSFGALDVGGPDSTQQRRIEYDIIDRLTALLLEGTDHVVASPKLRHTQEARHAPKAKSARPTTLMMQEVLSVRMLVVAILQSLCFTSHGGNAIATHPLATGRLVRFLHESVIALHAHHSATHTMIATLVNAAIRILAHLTACHASTLDLRTRLAAAPGGPQKHLVALARVAFADGAVGVDAEVVEAAHRMLDEYLSPEEGEAVVEVFSTAPSRGQAADG